MIPRDALGVENLHVITIACAGPYKTGCRRPTLKTNAQIMLSEDVGRNRGSGPMLDD